MKKENKKMYGLLAGVSVYQDESLRSLPAARRDLFVMKNALMAGLSFREDDIRLLGEDGTLSARSFARALSEFEGLTGREDVFFLYFSGHGTREGLCFFDEVVNLESIIRFVDGLHAMRKIILLDCCYSGEASLPRKERFSFEQILNSLENGGTAILSSCAGDEQSWLSESADVSLYTSVVASALKTRRLIRSGEISLNAISDEIRQLMSLWNRENPERAQHPIYRENCIGDICFQVQEYHPYIPQQITMETQDYSLRFVKPLSTNLLKRLAAFVILKGSDDSSLPRITRQIADQIKGADVYASRKSEEQLKGRNADVIWCYFAYDEEDIQRSNHFAYTIWTEDESLKKRYFRQNRNAEVVDGIYVFWNSSYKQVRMLQKTDTPGEAVIKEYKDLAYLLIVQAEHFIKAFEEVQNQTLSYASLKERFEGWIWDVRKIYYRLTDAQAPPREYLQNAEIILQLAGWVTDMSLFLADTDSLQAPGEEWMIKSLIARYHQALKKLQKAEIY